ncbi:amidohydrolase family protein [Rhodococcus qingshengii]
MNQTTVFEGANLIDGNGGAPRMGVTVVVTDGRITEVGDSRSVAIPERATRVDLTDKWLLPGLLNGNVHLTDSVTMMGPGGIEYLARHEHQLEDVIIEAAQVALKQGVTTVFDTHNAVGPVLAARDRIAAGHDVGARIFAAGNIVGFGGPFSADFFAAARQTASPTFVKRINAEWEAGVGHQLALLPVREIRSRVRDYLDRGVDMLKIGVSDHIYATVGLDRSYLTFSEQALRVMVEEARKREIPVLSHTLSVHALQLSVDLDADVLIHATITMRQPIDRVTIDAILAKDLACGVQTVTDKFQNMLDSVKAPLAVYGDAANERLLMEAGANIFLSTDAGCTPSDVLEDLGEPGRDERPWTLGSDHFDWVRGITEKGMSPMTAIVSATANVARAYKKFDELGSIEPGKAADLLVLNADPLDSIDNLRDIHSVYKAGVEIDRGSLPNRPLVTKRS